MLEFCFSFSSRVPNPSIVDLSEKKVDICTTPLDHLEQGTAFFLRKTGVHAQKLIILALAHRPQHLVHQYMHQASGTLSGVKS